MNLFEFASGNLWLTAPGLFLIVAGFLTLILSSLLSSKEKVKAIRTSTAYPVVMALVFILGIGGYIAGYAGSILNARNENISNLKAWTAENYHLNLTDSQAEDLLGSHYNTPSALEFHGRITQMSLGQYKDGYLLFTNGHAIPQR